MILRRNHQIESSVTRKGFGQGFNLTLNIIFLISMALTNQLTQKSVPGKRKRRTTVSFDYFFN